MPGSTETASLFQRIPDRSNDQRIFGIATLTMATCRLEILAAPEMNDAREVNTILTASLHALFGDFDGEHHACQAVVTNSTAQTPSTFHIECPKESMSAVRAALSMVTPPPYLYGTVYRFDVKKVVTS
mmetsp:Transcript_29452/g.70807  ORF Transcript_29452/g.70807 Transcript_29452/m.70807 type:complete len:128 (+) Transcript_29452:21-404(+)